MLAFLLPEFPSVILISPIERVGIVGKVSSLDMVPKALPLERVAPTGEPRTTLNVSSGSLSVSPSTETLMFLLVSPGAKERVPLVEV
jgi:hypothetical protein